MKTEIILLIINDKSEATDLMAKLVDQAEISKRVLKETHDEFNPQDPLNCIINPAHRDDIAFHLVG